MHQDYEDGEMFANARPVEVNPPAGRTVVAFPPVEQGPTVQRRRLKGRAAVKNQSLLWMATKGLFFTWLAFTFISGFFFVQVPLFNLLLQTFQNNVVIPYRAWYAENGTDAYMVMSSLGVAASAVAILIAVNVIRKFDIDLTVKHTWLNFVWNPIKTKLAPKKRVQATRKAA